mmetsp:Transcript_5943/g.14396  ORF Transcript_5943/g.14396 Transcript_5943/m.14396 type:complete len:93 (+) Transcript_5943:50-328(+)
MYDKDMALDTPFLAKIQALPTHCPAASRAATYVLSVTSQTVESSSFSLISSLFPAPRPFQCLVNILYCPCFISGEDSGRSSSKSKSISSYTS